MEKERERALLTRGLTGKRADVLELVRYITPVIHARVARAMVAHSRGLTHNLAHEVEDLAQEIFGILFANDARILRAWDATRGRSLANYVGLVARTRTISILRTAKRNPWLEAPTSDDELHRLLPAGGDMEPSLITRDLIQRALVAVHEEQTTRGRRLFDLLFAKSMTNEEIETLTGMSRGAVHQWRSRLNRLLRKKIETLMSTADPPPRISSQGGTDA